MWGSGDYLAGVNGQGAPKEENDILRRATYQLATVWKPRGLYGSGELGSSVPKLEGGLLKAGLETRVACGSYGLCSLYTSGSWWGAGAPPSRRGC